MFYVRFIEFGKEINLPHENNYFKSMIQQLASCLKTVLADKGYDDMANRKLCWDNNIEVHIPFKEYDWARKCYEHKPKMNAKRKRALQKFDQNKYNKRAS
jgi:hypothetical protein